MARGKKQHTPEQVVSLLQQIEEAAANGKTKAEACQECGIAEQTYYSLRKRYGGLQADLARRIKELDQENANLKRLVSELCLQKLALRDIIARGGL
jgi:hypothetical protein